MVGEFVVDVVVVFVLMVVVSWVCCVVFVECVVG